MNLKKINFISNLFHKKNIFIIIFLSILTTLLEMIGIGSVIPLLTSLSENDSVFEKFNFSEHYINYSQENLILFFLLLIVIIFLIKNFFLFFVNLFQSTYLFSFYNFLMKEILNIYLRQPYNFHLNRNSALLMRNIRKETSGFINGLKSTNNNKRSLILVAIISLLFLIMK